MDENAIRLSLEYLDKLAVKLDTTVEMVWPWIVRQVYVEFFVYLLVTILLGILLGSLLRYAIKHWDTKKGYSIYKEDHEEFWVVGLMLLSILECIFLIITAVSTTYILNPNYAALEYVINLAR
jgi:hypothetical protein